MHGSDSVSGGIRSTVVYYGRENNFARTVYDCRDCDQDIDEGTIKKVNYCMRLEVCWTASRTI